MTTFDPRTSYLADHELHDFIESADYEPPATSDSVDRVFGLRAKKLNATDPGYQGIALALGLNAEDTVLVVWMPLDSAGLIQPFNPQVNGLVVLNESLETWVIDRITQNRFGHWEMGVTEARENAGSDT